MFRGFTTLDFFKNCVTYDYSFQFKFGSTNPQYV